MINEKQIQIEPQVEEVPSLPPVPAPSKLFFDGFAAALWGTVLGSGIFTVATVSTVLHFGGGPSEVYTVLGVTTLLTAVGCLVHLKYKKDYHNVTGVRHFMRIFALGFLLGLLMVLILPGLGIGAFLWANFRSIQEESAVLKQTLESSVIISQINNADNHASCH